MGEFHCGVCPGLNLKLRFPTIFNPEEPEETSGRKGRGFGPAKRPTDEGAGAESPETDRPRGSRRPKEELWAAACTPATGAASATAGGAPRAPLRYGAVVRPPLLPPRRPETHFSPRRRRRRPPPANPSPYFLHLRPAPSHDDLSRRRSPLPDDDDPWARRCEPPPPPPDSLSAAPFVPRAYSDDPFGERMCSSVSTAALQFMAAHVLMDMLHDLSGAPTRK